MVGFIGVGKTEIGRALAVSLKVPFFDIDGKLEADLKMSVSEIIAKHGLERFRDMETEALEGVMKADADCVVATGGGTLARPANRAMIRSQAKAVWLKAQPETIWKRVQDKPYVAPLFYTQQDPLMAIRVEMSRRERYYQEVAHMGIEVNGKTPDSVAEEIKEVLRSE